MRALYYRSDVEHALTLPKVVYGMLRPKKTTMDTQKKGKQIKRSTLHGVDSKCSPRNEVLLHERFESM